MNKHAKTYEKIKRRRKQVATMLGGECLDCGETDVRVLEHHHRDPSMKKYNVTMTMSWKKILAEIWKCNLLCANCHRLKHSVFNR